MSIDLGQIYRSTYDVTDASGALINAATVTLAISTFDASGVATTTTPSVTNPPASTGHYLYDHPTTVESLHRFAWSTATPTTAKTDWIWVGAFRSIISIAEARAHLNEQSTLQDEEIRAFMECATQVVENIVGPVLPKVDTFRVRSDRLGTRYELLLPPPVAAVTSVTSIPAPTSTWTTGFDVDGPAGIISLLSGAPFANGPWNVVYTGGRPTTVGANIRQATKEMLWHLWSTQRGALADSTAPDLVDVATFESAVPAPFSAGFTIPNRVRELLELEQVPGFA